MTEEVQKAAESGGRKKTRWGRRVLAALGVLLGLTFLLAIVFGVWFRSQLRQSLPTAEGRLAVAGLTAEVDVAFDELAIPTIRGERRLDVAMATGFLHAQNRFFQMDLQRRRAAGELSELFGAVALNADRPIRVHRLRALSAATLTRLPASQRELLDAYAAGVNAGLEALGAKPFEYILLRGEPRPWRPEDSLLVTLAMFIELNDENGANESAIGATYDLLPAALADFLNNQGTEWDTPLVGEPFASPPVPGPDEVDLRSHKTSWKLPDRPKDRRPTNPPPVPGSNAWVVSGEHTVDGKPLLAVDMHLALTVPNIWYRASFVWPRTDGGEHRVTGITLPGLPVMVLGSNGDVAWGFTALLGDVGDVVLLESDPASEDSYRTPEGPRPFERHQELIAVKGGDDELLEVVSTQWGPVIGKDHRSRSRVFRWTVYLEGGLDVGLVGLETARSVDEALDVANRTGSPALNIVAADRDGHIGWSVAGRLPARVGFDGRRSTSWADGSRRWEGLLPPEEVPRIVDPESGRLWSANHRAVDGEMLAKLGEGRYVLGARARQIRDALLALEAATAKDMLALQLDDRALFLERWRDLLLGFLTPEAVAADERRAQMRRLVEDDWSGHASVDSVGYRMVSTFRFSLILNVFLSLTEECVEADEFFAWHFDGFQLEGPVWRLMTERPPHLLDPRYASWEELALTAVDDTLDDLSGVGPLAERTWGERNTTAIHHPLAMVPGLGGWLNMPPRPLPGDAHMPRVQEPGFGASQRMVVSPGQEEHGIFHMPGGQSGHPSSPHYRDGHEAWVRGEATPLLPGPTVRSLVLVPASPG